MTSLSAHAPRASIVMSAAATPQQFFAESISSCLEQTVSDFELIVIDDGLSEENKTFLTSLHDPRLIVIKNEHNIGQSKSVNKGMRRAHGTYIVRMDADDMMLPTRLATEIAFMDEHPDVIAASARAELTSTGRVVPKRVLSEDELTCSLFFANTLVHPTMIIRRDAAVEVGLWYDEDILYAQDYKFWADALEVGVIALIPEVVLRYRVHSGQISAAKRDAQTACARIIQRKLAAQMGFTLDDFQLTALSIFSLGTTDELKAAGLGITDIESLVGVLSDQARDVMSPAMSVAFARELRLRTVKFYLRCFREHRSLAMLRSPSFWRAVVSVKYLSLYKSEL